MYTVMKIKADTPFEINGKTYMASSKTEWAVLDGNGDIATSGNMSLIYDRKYIAEYEANRLSEIEKETVVKETETTLVVQAIIFDADGTVYDHSASCQNHPAQRRLEKTITELKVRQSLPSDEIEIEEILSGKTMSDLENAVVKAALDTLQAAIDITLFNMNPRGVVQVA